MTEHDNVTDLPQSFDFDLDSWQPDAKDVKPPFRVKVNGRVIAFSDPRDEDWRDLVGINNPVQFIKVCTSDEDRRFLLNEALPSRKLDALMKGFMEHFEVDEAIAEAQKQQRLAQLGG